MSNAYGFECDGASINRQKIVPEKAYWCGCCDACWFDFGKNLALNRSRTDSTEF